MSFSVGIVGLPNVGKSTLFKALTKKEVAISPRPFTTIDPNFGQVAVPDERLEKVAEIIKPEKVTPTVIEFVDIAGLVKGAHKGEGLGNQFLAHIKNCDAILEVVRSFEDPGVENVLGEINPEKEIEIVKVELLMKDLEALENLISKLEKKQDKKRASGKIIIYNTYSSDPQPLIATTRFLTPDGKIFRLEQKIVVPGAKIVEGKIVASNIETTVVADQAGPQYNIGPVSHFSIPGFQGSPKYQSFYAESKEAMKGGFIGEQAFPTDEDIKKGKEKSEKDLKDYINSFLSLQISPEFKVIEGAKQFNILKEEVNQEVDEKGNFTIFIEAESSVIGFRESDLKNVMEKMAQVDLGMDFKIKSYSLDYGVGRADFKQGRISFAFNFQGIFEQPLDAENFRQKAVKRNENELKLLISSFPNIEKIAVSFWPFWVKRVSDKPERVKIEVE